MALAGAGFTSSATSSLSAVLFTAAGESSLPPPKSRPAPNAAIATIAIIPIIKIGLNPPFLSLAILGLFGTSSLLFKGVLHLGQNFALSETSLLHSRH